MEVSGSKQDDSAAGSQSFYELTCEPCNREEGKHLKAVALCLGCEEYFCHSCVKSHKRFGITKDHVLLEGDKMPKTKPARRKQMASKPEDECTDRCDKHRGELIKYYCKDHKVVGCMDCITLKHKSCAGAQLISDISCQKEAKQLSDSFKIKLQALTADIGRHLQVISENRVEADNQYQAAISNIRKFKSEIIDALNTFEKVIEKEAKEQKEADMKSMDDISASCKSLSKNIADLETEFDALQNSNKKSQLFTLVHKTRSQLEEWDRQSKDIHMRNKIQKYTFEPEGLIRDVLQNTSGLGKLVRKDGGTQQRTDDTLSSLEATRENQGGWICPKCSFGSQQTKLGCGHLLCPECAREQIKQERPCSDCGVITGSQPQGSQDNSIYRENWIKLTFTFPDGIQLPHHPQPGQKFRGKSLVCFLTNDDRGRTISRLLDLAFKRGLIGRLQDGTVIDNVELFTWNPLDFCVAERAMEPWIWEVHYENWIPKITKRLKYLGIHE